MRRRWMRCRIVRIICMLWAQAPWSRDGMWGYKILQLGVCVSASLRRICGLLAVESFSRKTSHPYVCLRGSPADNFFGEPCEATNGHLYSRTPAPTTACTLSA